MRRENSKRKQKRALREQKRRLGLHKGTAHAWPEEGGGDGDAARDSADPNAALLDDNTVQELRQRDAALRGSGAGPGDPALSKSARRKLRQIEERKRKAEERAKVVASLRAASIGDAELSLMRRVGASTARETRREKASRGLAMERAGLAVDASIGLYRRGPAGGDGAIDGAEQGAGRPAEGVDAEIAGARSGESGSESESDGISGDGLGAGRESEQRSGDIGDVGDEDEKGEQKEFLSKETLADVGRDAGMLSLSLKALEDMGMAQGSLSAPVQPLAGPQAAAVRALRDRLRHEAGEGPDDAAAGAGAAGLGMRSLDDDLRVHRQVHVERSAEVEEGRRGLPILGMEQEIMEAVYASDVVLLCGETGCGKTTQVPQFFLEAGFGCRDFPERRGMVGVTQPRRVAATSTAARVAQEVGSAMGGAVGYQIRHDRRVGEETRIKFMTDGILLRETQEDFLLRQYSVVMVDEAHERSLNSDVLLGLLSRVVRLRRKLHAATRHLPASDPRYVAPLKLVVMSATLRVEDFAGNRRLFESPPPVIRVPARQYPVTVHFAKHTEMDDYVSAAYRKVLRIHRELPHGGILVFLTGQREVELMCSKLRKAFPKPRAAERGVVRGSGDGAKGAAVAAERKPKDRNGKRGREGASGPGGLASSALESGNDGVRNGDGDGSDGEGAGGFRKGKEDEGEYVDDEGTYGLDAAEAWDGRGSTGRHGLAGDGGVGGNSDWGDGGDWIRDDYEEGERDEDEDEVVVMGAEGWSAEAVAEAERRINVEMARAFRGEPSAGHDDDKGGRPQSVTAPAPSLAKGRGSRGGLAGEGAGQEDAWAAGAKWMAGVLRGAPGTVSVSGIGVSESDTAAGAVEGAGDGPEDGPGYLHVLPLYAMLPAYRQKRVFETAPPGARLVVVATNVAETSLTIPGIRYVVDAGRAKQKILDEGGGMARFEVRWVSKASAEQRAGRAGRTGPGHCYRLYSSAHFNDTFPAFSPPEIANTPLEGLMLFMKSLGVDRVENFPFPTPPSPDALASACACLTALSACDRTSGLLTPLGRAMACFPVPPRHARMILEVLAGYQPGEGLGLGSKGGARGEGDEGGDGWVGAGLGGAGGAGVATESGAGTGSAERIVLVENVLPYAVAMAAVLSVDSPFVHLDAPAVGTEAEGDKTKEAKEAQRARRSKLNQAQWAIRGNGRSDAISALRALCAFEAAGETDAFCRENGLHPRNLREAAATHRQLARVLATPDRAGEALKSGSWGELYMAASEAGSVVLGKRLELPQPWVETRLRRALAAGWADRVARRVRSTDIQSGPQDRAEPEGRRLRALRYQACALEDHVYLHPNSVLARTAPEYVVYSEAVSTGKRPYMSTVTEVDARWLPHCAPAMCAVTGPISDPPPEYFPPVDAVMGFFQASYGRWRWQLPPHAAPHPSATPADATSCAAAFASALLQGSVSPTLATLGKHWVVAPEALLRPEGRFQPQALALITRLEKARAWSRAALRERWETQPDFLMEELARCVRGPEAHRLRGAWAEVVRGAREGAHVGGRAPGKKKGKKRAF